MTTRRLAEQRHTAESGCEPDLVMPGDQVDQLFLVVAGEEDEGRDAPAIRSAVLELEAG